MEFSFFDSTIFKWMIVPLLIFCSRIADVSIGTIRIIYISKGMKYLAPVFGFFEILIWLVAIGQIMRNLSNPVYYIAYSLGFAAGNFVGIIIENRLAVGKVMLRIVTQKDAGELLKFLRSEGYGVTAVDAHGSQGMVNVIFTVISRKSLDGVIAIVQKFNPKAFFSVEDVRMAREGVFPPSKEYFSFFKTIRKGK